MRAALPLLFALPLLVAALGCPTQECSQPAKVIVLGAACEEPCTVDLGEVLIGTSADVRIDVQAACSGFIEPNLDDDAGGTFAIDNIGFAGTTGFFTLHASPQQAAEYEATIDVFTDTAELQLGARVSGIAPP